MTGKFFGLSVISLLVGIIRSNTGNYLASSCMLAGFSIVATLIAIWAYYEDTKTGGVLEASRL